jgi:hypothetical protein
MIRFLLLHRMDWTNEHPAFGLIGLGVMVILAGILSGLMP